MNIDPELNPWGMPVRCFCGGRIAFTVTRGRPNKTCSPPCARKRNLELKRRSGVSDRWRELANERARLNHPVTIRPGYDATAQRRYAELRPISSIQLPGKGFAARAWNALAGLTDDDRTG